MALRSVSAAPVADNAAALPALSSRTRLLMVSPHPDDETIGTGVLIQQVLAAGGAVQVLSLTGGDNNPWPQRWLEKRLRIGRTERQRWGQRRQRELHAALSELGLTPAALRQLGWSDQGLTARLRHHLHDSVEVIARALDAFLPTLIALPSLHDGHPDHSAAHVLVRLALEECSSRPECVAYLIHGADGEPASVVAWKASDALLARKRSALEQHVSQLALSGGRMRRLAGRQECFERVNVQAATGASHVVLPWQPPALLHPLLRLIVVAADGTTRTLRWSKAPLHRDVQGRWCLQLTGPAAQFVKLELRVPTFWIFDHWGWFEVPR